MRRWKDPLCSWIGKIIIMKMDTLLKTVYRFNAIPIKIPMSIFTKTENSIKKPIWTNPEE
jgi:hypothetical protein